MNTMKAWLLLIATAGAELLGCWLTYAWLRQARSPWLLIPSAISLATFAWLLTLHPTASGRTYAAYGGVYVAAALLWLATVDGQPPDRWDLLGVSLTLAGTAVITFAPHA